MLLDTYVHKSVSAIHLISFPILVCKRDVRIGNKILIISFTSCRQPAVVIALPYHVELHFIFFTSAASNKRQYDASMSRVIHFSDTLGYSMPRQHEFNGNFERVSNESKLISGKFGPLTTFANHDIAIFHSNLWIFAVMFGDIIKTKKTGFYLLINDKMLKKFFLYMQLLYF